MTTDNQPEVSSAEEVSSAPDFYKGSIFEGMSFDEPVQDLYEGDDGSLTETNPEPSATEGGTPEPVEEVPARHRVKIDGEERELTFEELVSLAQQGGNYTRRSQELAEERRLLQPFVDLREALKQNPQQMLAELARQSGVALNFGEQQQHQDEWSWLGEEAPQQETPTQLEQRLARLESVETQRALDAQTAQHLRTIDQLHQEFGDFDERELVLHAQQHNHPNLISAFRDLHWDRAPALKQAGQVVRTEAEQAVIDQKRADAVVEGGSATAAGSVKAPPPNYAAMKSVREVAEATMAELKAAGRLR